MIKFGIPSSETVVDSFPGQAVLTMHALEKENSKRRFSISKTAAEQFGINPGLSKVAFSFDGGNFVAVIPDGQGGVAEKDKYLVGKNLAFVNKDAYGYMAKKFELDTSIDNNMTLTIEDKYGLKVGTFTSTPMVTEAPAPVEEVNVDTNPDIL